MVAFLNELLALEGKRAEIEFADGEIVVAVVLKVDTQEHDDVTFDVKHVKRSTTGTRYTRSNVYVAPLASVVSVREANEGDAPR